MKTRRLTRKAAVNPATKRKSSSAGFNRIDELGIKRGQNAEKGNTVRPENIHQEKQASR